MIRISSSELDLEALLSVRPRIRTHISAFILVHELEVDLMWVVNI